MITGLLNALVNCMTHPYTPRNVLQMCVIVLEKVTRVCVSVSQWSGTEVTQGCVSVLLLSVTSLTQVWVDVSQLFHEGTSSTKLKYA